MTTSLIHRVGYNVLLADVQIWNLQEDKEAEKRDRDYTTHSNFAAGHSLATLTSMGSPVSMYVAPEEETGPMQMDSSADQLAPGLPSFKNSSNLSNLLAPKVPDPGMHAASTIRSNNNQRLHQITPKVAGIHFLQINVLDKSCTTHMCFCNWCEEPCHTL